MAGKPGVLILVALVTAGPVYSLQRLVAGYAPVPPVPARLAEPSDSSRGVSHGRHILIGAASGALIGGAIGAVSYRLHPGDSESLSPSAQILGSALFGAVIGSLTAWIIAALRD